MSDPEKNGGSDLPHSVFRVGDRLELLADAEHKKVEEMARWRVLFERLVALIERLMKTQE